MNSIVKKTIVFLLTVLMVFSPVCVNAEEDVLSEDYFASILGSDDSTADDEETEEILTPTEAIEKAKERNSAVSIENSKFSLIIDKTSGYLYVINKENNNIWTSNPWDASNDELASGITRTNLRSVLVVKFVFSGNIESTNSYAGSVTSDSVKYDVQDNSIRVDYEFPSEGFSIPVLFELTDTGFDASVIFEEIKDTADRRIHKIELLPYFGAGGLTDDGYMFVPDGSGAKIEFNNGKSEFAPYEKDFFGGNKGQFLTVSATEEEQISLPVYGIVKADDAFVGVVTSGAECSSIYASVSGKICNYNRIYTSATYREYDTVNLSDVNGKDIFAKYTALESVSLDKYTISYSILSNENANIVGMANATRESLFSNTLSLHNEPLKMYVDFYGAVEKEKSFLGIRFTGVNKLTTFSQAKEILSELNNKGISSLEVGYRYFSKASYKGMISSEISPSSKLGGKRGFNQLLDYASQINANIYPYVDFVTFRKNGKGYSSSKDVIMGLQLSVIELFPYNINDGVRNTFKDPYYLVSAARYNKASNKLISSLSKFDTGLLLDESVNYIYSDFSRGGYQASQVVDMQEKIYKDINKQGNAIMMSNPNAYALQYANNLTDIPMESSNYYLFDGDLPFIHIVLKGYIPYSTKPLNIKGVTDTTYLKLIETGSNPKFNMIYSEGKDVIGTELSNELYGAHYVSCVDTACRLYDGIKEFNEKTESSYITYYDKNDDVVTVKYSNGVVVIINYSDSDVTVNENNIPSYGYVVMDKEVDG